MTSSTSRQQRDAAPPPAENVFTPDCILRLPPRTSQIKLPTSADLLQMARWSSREMGMVWLIHGCFHARPLASILAIIKGRAGKAAWLVARGPLILAVWSERRNAEPAQLVSQFNPIQLTAFLTNSSVPGFAHREPREVEKQP